MSAATGKPLLVELYTEEMPPLLLGDVADSFAAGLVKALADARLCDPEAKSQNWSTPRRIAVLVQNVAAKSPTTTGLRRGPSVQNAYGKDGKPAAALTGFLRSSGAKQKDLQEVEHKGQQYVAVPHSGGGEPLGALLGLAIERAVARTTAPRLMRWSSVSKHRFVRPISSICAVHGKQPVASDAFGEATLRHSFGHQFLAPAKVRITDAEAYPKIMRDHKVLVDAAERRAEITKQARKLASQVRIDETLLGEIANMCEWPLCYSANFDAKYQELPDKVIETCMGKHLRSFAVGKGKLTNQFIFVADNKPSNGGLLQKGLERVMKARLDDTLFIFLKDRQTNPAGMLDNLAGINYIQGMGSMRDRCERIKELATKHYPEILDLELDQQDADILEQAATFIKADLGTLLIDEYPGLEGHIGGALLTELPQTARDLIAGHLDRGLDEELNRCRDALVLALEVERLVTMAATAGLPKGSKDPLGLRRAMGRVVHILLRYRKSDINKVLGAAWEICHAAADKHGALKAKRFAADGDQIQLELKRYAIIRLMNMTSDLLNKEIEQRLLNAVTVRNLELCERKEPLNLRNFLKRTEALKKFKDNSPKMYDTMLATAKRLDNIGGGTKPGEVNLLLFKIPAEEDLYLACKKFAEEWLDFFQTHDYDSFYQRVTEITPLVDRFFDEVLVNDDDEKLRRNRLNIVRFAAGLLNAPADTRSLYA